MVTQTLCAGMGRLIFFCLHCILLSRYGILTQPLNGTSLLRADVVLAVERKALDLKPQSLDPPDHGLVWSIHCLRKCRYRNEIGSRRFSYFCDHDSLLLSPKLMK